MAAAVLVPNVEFIFGLTGATASVLISYILPALTFIRLLDTSHELTSGMHRQTKVGCQAMREHRQELCLCYWDEGKLGVKCLGRGMSRAAACTARPRWGAKQ